MNNKKCEKNIGLFVKITEIEKGMLEKMKVKYSINISQLFRNTIRELYKKMENDNEKK